MKKIKVIVCGVRFGKFYLEAIMGDSENFELVGILARGSDNARECAKKYGVPLYTDINQLSKKDVDMACVVVRSSVVGGEGTKLALGLLEKGISVIQEQPVHLDDYIQCMKIARNSMCRYQVNGFYAGLPNVRYFINSARKVFAMTTIRHLSVDCTIQVLYSTIDIIGKIVGGLTGVQVIAKSIQVPNEPFVTIELKASDLPISLRVFNCLDPKNPDNLYLLQRISMITDSGTLMLTDTNGLVLWHASMPQITREQTKGLWENQMPVTTILNHQDNVDQEYIYKKIWPSGVRYTLRGFREKILENQFFDNTIQQGLEVCRLWKQIGKEIGKAEVIEYVEKKTIELSELR